MPLQAVGSELGLALARAWGTVQTLDSLISLKNTQPRAISGHLASAQSGTAQGRAHTIELPAQCIVHQR